MIKHLSLIRQSKDNKIVYLTKYLCQDLIFCKKFAYHKHSFVV